MPPLERSPSTQPCSNFSWEQNGYYAAQDFLRVSEENVRWIKESFECSSRKSSHRAGRELGIPQPIVWRVLRRRLPFNWVHLFESPCILKKNYFYINKVGTSPKNGISFYKLLCKCNSQTRALGVDHVQSTESKTTQMQDHNLHSTEDNVNISYTNFAYADYMFGINYVLGKLALL